MDWLRRVLAVGALTAFALVPVAAQDTAQASVTVSDELVINGILTIDSATVPEAGWIVIHAMVDGQPGPTVGIAQLQAGENQNVEVILDTLGATAEAVAMLHMDTGQTGMYEYDMMPENDLPIMQGDQPAMFSFRITALTVFPQMLNNNTVVVGSVISDQPTWVVISGDNGDTPGTALGSVLLPPGTHTPVMVPIAAEGQTGRLWARLHLDAGTAETFEFEGEGGADTPLTVGENVAMAFIDTAAEPVVLTMLGAPLENDPLPMLEAADQNATESDTVGALAVNRVFAPTTGWLEVHADSMGHPGKPLGMVNLPQGESTNVSVMLDALMIPAAPPMTLPPAVWPMLHIDDSQEGVYEYLMVPRADVPIVVNGAVVTYQVLIGGAEATPGMEMTPDMAATDDMMGTDDTMDMGGMADSTEAAPGSNDAGEPTAEATAAG